MEVPEVQSTASAQSAETTDQEAQSILDQENKKVPWSEEIWKAIDRVVHEETMRVRVGAQFLPRRRVHPKTTSVQADTIVNVASDTGTQTTLTIDEGVTIRLNEIWTEFALTTQQVHETSEAKSPAHTSAATLARRAAQYLALAQDIVIFQGVNGYSAPFFQANVRFRPGQQPLDGGLLSIPQGAAAPFLTARPFASTNPTIQVYPLTEAPAGVLWGENTFAAVASGCAALTAQGQSGPYALILQTVPYADLFAPVGIESLVVTADRIAPLVKAGLFGTGTLPPNPALPPAPMLPPAGAPYFGVLVSVGGDTMDLVVGQDAKAVFLQQDINQNWRFRVLERFALRVKDPSAIVPLAFVGA
jgi:uncharacterized linocin/CFP29 family protein